MSQSPNEQQRRGGGATRTHEVVRGLKVVQVSHLTWGDLTPAEVREMDRQTVRAYDAIGQVSRVGAIGGTVLA